MADEGEKCDGAVQDPPQQSPPIQRRASKEQMKARQAELASEELRRLESINTTLFTYAKRNMHETSIKKLKETVQADAEAAAQKTTIVRSHATGCQSAQTSKMHYPEDEVN